MADYTKQAAWGAVFILGGILIGSLAAYLLRILLTRNLSVPTVGLFFAVLNFVIFITLFQKIGLELGLVRFINKWRVKKQYDKITTSVLTTILYQFLVGLVYIIILLLLSEWLGAVYFKHPDAPQVLRLFSVLLLLLIFEDIPRRVLQSFHRMGWFSFIEAFKSILFLVLVFLAFFVRVDVLVPVYSFLAATLVVSLIGIIVAVKTFNIFKYRVRASKKVFSQLFVFSLPLIFFVLGNKIIETLDLLILTGFRDLSEVGIYSMVLPTAGLCMLLFRPIQVVMLSLGAELWERGQKAKLADAVSRLSRYLLVSMLPVMLLLFVFAELVLSLFFGREYAAGALALRIILAGVVFFGIAHFNMSILTSIGKSRHSGMIMFAGALCNGLFNILLIPFFGMPGAAAATTASYLLAYGMSHASLRKALRPKLPMDVFLKAMLSALVFVGVAAVLKRIIVAHILVEIVIVGAIALLVYVIFIYFLRLVTVGEIKNIIMLSLRRQK